MRFTVIIERGADGYGAYVPDLPGCIAAADSLQELKLQIREAIDFHISGLMDEGFPVPEPAYSAEVVDVDLHAA